MFSVRLVTADSYQATPLPQLDPTFSEFRGAGIKHVPIIRVFGTTPAGEKTCLHLHGVFPYLYVPYTGEENADSIAYRLAASLDSAINISLGSANSNTQHVYQIQRVAGIPFYGYHRKEHQFLKISFYNPAIMNKAIDLLHNGSVLNQTLQPHEAHIPYILQFMIDNNVHGMSFINLDNVKHRAARHSDSKPSSDSPDDLDYLPSNIQRQSICQLEVDAQVSDILNRKDLERGIKLNPGLAAIWEEERARRAQAGLPNDDSQLVNPKSPKRPQYLSTYSDLYHAQRLSRRLETILQSDESSLSTIGNKSLYPAEVPEGSQLLNASNLGNVTVQNLDRSQQLSEPDAFNPLSLSQESRHSELTHNSSTLDAGDLRLVEVLMEMAQESSNQERVDDDSVLGTQSSVLDHENKSDNEEEEAADLNLTCLELDSFGPWDYAQNLSPSHSLGVENLTVNNGVPQTSNKDALGGGTENNQEDLKDERFPQFDGAGDLSSSFLESDEEENSTGWQERMQCIPDNSGFEVKSQSILSTNLPCSVNEAFIVDELLTPSKTHRNSSRPIFNDGTWSSFLSSGVALEQYSMNFDALGSCDFEDDFENVLDMDVILPGGDELSISANLTSEEESIPLETVLNGDPCFTQTAEMDKSDLAELQDLYVSLVDSELVPDVYKDYTDNDAASNLNAKLDTKEKNCGDVAKNSTAVRVSCNRSSSENVTPNIQEPEPRMCKNKLSQSVGNGFVESCKDSKLTSDNSDHNCNVVATWEELQDLQFIPERIQKSKQFSGRGKQVLTQCSNLSYSMIRRKRGRGRTPSKINKKSNTRGGFRGEKIIDEPPDSSCNLIHDDLSQDMDENSEKFVSCERVVAPPVNNGCATVRFPIELWKKQRLECSLESKTSKMMSDSIFDDVQELLPDVQCSSYLGCEIDSPVLSELIHTDTYSNENIFPDNNCSQKSYYSSERSHNNQLYAKSRHRHCRYSPYRRILTANYVFASDQIWVIEKRKRGKMSHLSSEECTKNCRLPFVPLVKLEINHDKSSVESRSLVTYNNVFPNVNSTCNPCKIVSNENPNKNVDLFQSNVSIGRNSEKSQNNYCLKNTRPNSENMENSLSQETSTQSSQISSTQNHDVFEITKDKGVVIKRIFEDTSYNGTTRIRRSIILKLGSRNNDSINNDVSLSNPKASPTCGDSVENIVEAPIVKKKRGRPRKSETLQLSPVSENEVPEQKEIPKASLLPVNAESNISSSQINESLNKRPQIWCSIQLSRINLNGMVKNYRSAINGLRKLHVTASTRNSKNIQQNKISNASIQLNLEANSAKNQIFTELESEQFHNLDDSSLNYSSLNLCDSIYKDDEASNIFNDAENIEKSTGIISDHEILSDELTSAMTEASLFTGKNYTIDAISQEIPYCLFEEDSNSEPSPRKVIDSEQLSIDETTPETCAEPQTIDDNPADSHANVNPSIVDALSNQVVSTSPIIGADSPSNAPESFSINNEPATSRSFTEIRELIDGESLNTDDNCSESSRSQSPELDENPTHPSEIMLIDEEIIAKMMEKNLVFDEKTEVINNPNSINNFPFDQDVEFHPDVVDTPEESQSTISQDEDPSDNSPNYTNNNHLPCSQYSRNKISILHKIFMPSSRAATPTIENLNSDSVDVPSESISADNSELQDNDNDLQQMEDASLQDEVSLGESDSCTAENEAQKIGELNPDKMAEISLKIPVINIIRCDLSLCLSQADKTIAIDESDETSETREEIEDAPSCPDEVVSAESTDINNDQLPAEVRQPLQHCIARKESITPDDSESLKINPDSDNPKVDMLNESNNNRIIHRSDISESKANEADNAVVVLGELQYGQEITNTDVENLVVCETSQSCQVSIVKETYENPNEGFITEEPSVTNNQYSELVKPTHQNNLNEQLNAKPIIENTNLFNQLENPVTLIVDTLGISEVEIEIDDSQTISKDDSLINCSKEPIEHLENSVDKFPLTVCREFSIVLEKLSEKQLNKYMSNKSDDHITAANCSPEHQREFKKPRMNKSVKFDEEVFVFEYNKRVRLRDEGEEETGLSDDDFEEVPEEEQADIDDEETEQDRDADDEGAQDGDVSDVSNEDEGSKFDISPVFINVDDLPDTDEDLIDSIEPIILDKSLDVRENYDQFVNVAEDSNKLVIEEYVCINEKIPDTLLGPGVTANNASEEIYVDYEYLSEEIEELPETSAYNAVSSEFQTAIPTVASAQLMYETIDNDEGINSTEIVGESESLVAIEHGLKPGFIVLPHTEAADDIVDTQVPTQHRLNGAATSFDSEINDKSLIVNPCARNEVNSCDEGAQSNGFIRVMRTVTPYYKKTQTINMSPRMSYNRVTKSLPKFMKRSKKERFLARTGLYNNKPRISKWYASQTTTGFIQIQQPRVVLQRLSPSTLKYYGYTRRFKSNRYGKRFNSESNRCSIPAFDGAADLSSSDSDSEISASPESAETRACRYKSTKRRMEQIVTTPKKRPYASEDDDAAECQEQKKRCVLETAEAPTKIPYCSPNRRSMLRSPGLAGRYSPLKINIMTSPKVQKVAPIDCHKVPVDECIRDALCVTPRRRKVLQHHDLTQHRVSILSAGQSESVLPPAMNSENCLGELNILNNTADNSPGSKIGQLAEENSHQRKAQDIGSRVKDISIRKKLFFPTNKLNAIFSRLPPHPDNQRPSTSKGHSEVAQNHVPNIASEEEEEDLQFTGSDNTIHPDQTSGNSPTMSSNLEEENEDDNDIMNVTFTDYINSQMAKQSASSNDRPRASDNFVRIVPKFKPPTTQRVIDTMEQYNISTCIHVKPHFSNQADVPGEKELAHRILKVPGTGLTDLPVFKCSLDDITGLNRWRKMKVNEFHPLRNALSKTKSIRQSLAGHNYVIIKPLLLPPSIDSVRKWLRARDYLKKQENRQQVQLEIETLAKKSNDIVEDLEKTLSVSNSSIVEQSPEVHTKSRALNYPSKIEMTEKISLLKPSSAEVKTAHENSSNSSIFSSSGEPPASLLSILGKSRLFKDNDASKYLGISCGQIDYATMTNRGDANDENMQKVKALTQHQFITVLCVEVHVETREDLLPDPQHDSISAIFYAIQNDVPSTSLIKPLQHGVIAVAAEKNKLGYLHGSTVPFFVTLVASEEELFNSFIDIVTQNDPEIFIGWEIECLSWGYIFQRASKLGLNLSKRISRIPDSNCKWDTPNPDAETLAEVKLPGRIVLDIWRIMKSEVALLTYTFENVFYHVMNERLSCPSFKSLTLSWQLMKTRWKVVQHYSTKVLGILRMLEQLDIIGRTSEHARLFGIQFYEVFSRGSQYRVESIMLRLAKPLNYIPVSPSPQQRACMRAMEALPLIMEPESMFYSDPVIVLDFQSLYPSIIIAHNYCFSTCLGRIEHIGQLEPFEFGATVLQVKKNTALRLQNKINYSPCGVAFVKSEIRQGILPRMLTEILETRFMVKKAMKDHSKDNKLLQRVLQSRQHGLKYLANVTYGYTAANFSGRMPCIELGDSVISKSKETLERAIKLVETTSKWGARVVYGDTDSLFILVAGKSKDDAFKIGNEIADAVTASNLSPIKLRFEKVLYPSILQTKKRYCGYMYETSDQKEPTFLAKGIETVRRDGCPGVSKILTKTLKILFDTKDMSLVKKYVIRQLEKILNGKVSLEDLTFAKEFRGLKGYKERACVPALELTRRLMKKDPRAVPRRSERVRYVIVAGAPNEALIHCVKSPWEVINDPGLRPNGIYYVTRVIIPPINRCLNLMGVDVNTWYREMPHRYVLDNPVALPSDKQKQTIFQYFGTIVCTACGRPSNRGICSECTENPSTTLVLLHDKLRWLDRTYSHVTSICQSCVGRGDVADCVSLDCPVLYRRAQAQRKLSQACEFQRIIEEGCKHEF